MMTETETLTAEVSEEIHRIADETDALDEIMSAITVGDSLTVEYQTTTGLTNTERGEVTELSREFGDIRFGDSAYFHVNTSTGDYYFQSSDVEAPESGFKVEKITLEQRGNA